MTDPRKYLLRMLFFIIVVGAIIFILNEPLVNAFQANVAINGLIFGVLLVGIIFLCRQTIRLVPEKNWIESLQVQNKLRSKPVLMAPLALMLGEDNS